MKKASRLLKFKLPKREFSSVFKKDVWIKDKVVVSPCKDIVIPNMTLDEYFWRNIDKWPTKIATVCGITNRQYTYEKLYKQTRTFAANLRKKFNVDNGDTIAVMMRNTPEYPIAILGILGSGGIATTFNPVYTAHEVHRLLQLSEAKLVIADTESYPIVKTALELAKLNMPIIVLDINENKPEGAASFRELVEDVNVDLSILKDVKRSKDDIAMVPYSSGTTGLPKCVELSHYNFVSNCEQQNVVELKTYSDTTETNQDTVIAALPLFHSYGLIIVMLHHMSEGLRMVTIPKFHPDTFLNALTTYKVNLLNAAPPMVLFLGGHPSVTPKHLEYINFTVCGAAPLPPADIQNYVNKTRKDVSFCQGYGMTEAGPLVSLSPRDLNRHETVGIALPNITLRVVDSKMNSLGPNEVGELLIKSPGIMKGYKDNPESTAESFEDGWYKSGDMAKIDEQGLITISDRLKELIKVNAYQVPPAELEYVLKEHPDVFDAAVLGIPDPTSGERPKAFIVLKDGAKSTETDIKKFVDERVAKFKRIKEVVFIESIPKNPSGKILRKDLKQKYC